MSVPTNPLEQAWWHDGDGAVWCRGRLTDLVHQPTPGHAQSQDEVMARGAVIASAPRLYRALEALLDAASIDKTAPEFIEARAALKAARGEE